MNKCFFLFLWIGLMNSSAWLMAQNQKRALIITIGNYINSSQWKPLIAAEHDLGAISSILSNQNFPVKNTISLHNTKATKDAIYKGFAELIQSANENDKIVIYFSGHGFLVNDTNKDENDNYDECLVPYDAPSGITKDYKKNGLIKDDTLGILIDKLRAKVKKGGEVFFILDACHSGTADKGDDSIPKEDLYNSTLSDTYFSQKKSSLYNFNNFNLPMSNILGKYVFLAACADKQSTVPIKLKDNKTFLSLLTHQLFTAFNSVKPGITYSDLFRYIQSQYPTNYPKTLIIKGDVGATIFDGQITKMNEKFSFKKINENEVKLYAGFLSDVNEGAKFEFKKDEIFDTRNSMSLASGVVVKSEAFESIIKLKGALPDKISLVAIQTEKTLGDYKIGLKLKDFKDKSLQKSLEDSFSSKNILSLSNEKPELILEEKEDAINITSASSGKVYNKIPKDENITQNVVDKILDYCRAKIISALEINNPDFRAEVSLKHGSFITKMNDNGEKVRINTTSHQDSLNNDLVFDTTQQSYFTIKNIGNEKFYFTLIDIQPDGVMHVLLPNSSKSFLPEDLALDIGKSLEIPFKAPKPPYGKEIYKIIMSSKIEDFTFLNSTNRDKIEDNQKGDESPIVALFKDLTDGSMKRTKGDLPIVGGTATIKFEIVLPKK